MKYHEKPHSLTLVVHKTTIFDGEILNFPQQPDISTPRRCSAMQAAGTCSVPSKASQVPVRWRVPQTMSRSPRSCTLGLKGSADGAQVGKFLS
jgi:hypothetical protein